jgi:hypothetical protein
MAICGDGRAGVTRGAGRSLASGIGMNDPINQPDLNDDDNLDVHPESSRGGNEPPPEENDRPDQNVGYDEAAKGRPLTRQERRRAERESPLADKSRMV